VSLLAQEDAPLEYGFFISPSFRRRMRSKVNSGPARQSCGVVGAWALATRGNSRTTREDS